jgi:hypothetical protein
MQKGHVSWIFALVLALSASLPVAAADGRVVIKDDHLHVDGVAQPQLFGAEIQYFRLRGGYGPNQPRARVLEIWARTLDLAVEAGMNTVSFYIPWDFHEYAQGKFDFDGTVDEDGDGNADYPSRDLFTWFRMLEERGLKTWMVRPGPYINAEWGFLGFGAIPQWFHEAYPDAHMRNSQGLRTKLYDYHDPEFLRHTQLWFKALHEQVLKPFIGAGKPIVFLQLDNESNFMWQSLYSHDYGPRALMRYRGFLQKMYDNDLAKLNAAHGRIWASWDEVLPPVAPKENLPEDRDWYAFQDHSLYSYLRKVRRMWEALDVKEPEVLFNLAESYNATENGLLPNYLYRNDPGKTGLMTVNLYPKTFDLPSRPLLNQPFKAQHDVKAAREANARYHGSLQDWVMGPEIQGGWWRGTDVTKEARQQTYLSVLGHGLKALYIYYFNQGDNWGDHWALEQVRPIFWELRNLPEWQLVTNDRLPDAFWKLLQAEVDRRHVVGIDAWGAMHGRSTHGRQLYFDAPVDGDGTARAPFALVKKLGTELLGGTMKDTLADMREIDDAVGIVKDDASHRPSPLPAVDSVLVNGEWSGSLLGWIQQRAVNPRIFHMRISNESEMRAARVLFYQDTGHRDAEREVFFSNYVREGGTLVNMVGDSNLAALFPQVQPRFNGSNGSVEVGGFVVPSWPLFAYENLPEGCKSLLESAGHTVAFECAYGSGRFIQLGAAVHASFNTSTYSELGDVPARLALLDTILAPAGVTSFVGLPARSERLTAWARGTPDRNKLLVTTKNARNVPVRGRVRVACAGASEAVWSYRQLLGGASGSISCGELRETGLRMDWDNFGSEATLFEAPAL